MSSSFPARSLSMYVVLKEDVSPGGFAALAKVLVYLRYGKHPDLMEWQARKLFLPIVVVASEIEFERAKLMEDAAIPVWPPVVDPKLQKELGAIATPSGQLLESREVAIGFRPREE